jgi:DNA-binding CsgD family transcriptional regulator
MTLPNSIPAEAERARCKRLWLVISDCWLDGRPQFWGTILELEPAKAEALRAAGRVILCTPIVHREFGRQVRRLLTKRERDVIGLADLLNKQIADRLKISIGTVRRHFQSISTKLRRPGRTGAALFWQAWTRTRF